MSDIKATYRATRSTTRSQISIDADLSLEEHQMTAELARCVTGFGTQKRLWEASNHDPRPFTAAPCGEKERAAEMTSRIDAMYPNCGHTCTQCGNLCKRGTAIDAHFAGRLAFMLECVILDPHGHFDAACQLLDEYKAEWEKVNPSPPTFMGAPKSGD